MVLYKMMLLVLSPAYSRACMYITYPCRETGDRMQVLTAPPSPGFSFTPSDLNHEISFNATKFAVDENFTREAFPLSESTFVLTCSFINGMDASDLISPVNIRITLQEGERYDLLDLINTNVQYST